MPVVRLYPEVVLHSFRLAVECCPPSLNYSDQDPFSNFPPSCAVYCIIPFMTDYNFTHPIEVRYGDLDPQGHLNNARYLTYFEQARIFYFTKLGLFMPGISFMDIGVILADVHLTFHAPVLFGMDVHAGVRTTRLGNKSFTVEQALIDRSTAAQLCTGELVVVTYDYHTGQTMPIPLDWREKISMFEDLKTGVN
jgi:acyl-CoA thioester hydrolase